jgi:hypothetical protein
LRVSDLIACAVAKHIYGLVANGLRILLFSKCQVVSWVLADPQLKCGVAGIREASDSSSLKQNTAMFSQRLDVTRKANPG